MAHQVTLRQIGWSAPSVPRFAYDLYLDGQLIRSQMHPLTPTEIDTHIREHKRGPLSSVPRYDPRMHALKPAKRKGTHEADEIDLGPDV